MKVRDRWGPDALATNVSTATGWALSRPAAAEYENPMAALQVR
jgi:hypothetical protein